MGGDRKWVGGRWMRGKVGVDEGGGGCERRELSER